jgi:hypothetical protein
MRKVVSWGAMVVFLAASCGPAVAWEPKSDGTPKTTKDKWIEQKKEKIDQDAAQQKKKVVAPGMKAVDQAGADQKIKDIDTNAAKKKAQVDDDAKKLGGDHIYQKNKPKSTPGKSSSSITTSAKSKEPK